MQNGELKVSDSGVGENYAQMKSEIMVPVRKFLKKQNTPSR